jgi:hypothetical protein
MIGHLSPAELLDIAEGALSEAARPHLAVCDACRGELTTIRATIEGVRAVDVPEPSPLFWNHLSRRVREAVAAEGAAPQESWNRRRPRWGGAAVTMAAAAALAVIVGLYSQPESSMDTPLQPPGLASATLDDGAATAFDDPSLRFVADLVDELEPDAVAEMFASRDWASGDVAVNLSAAERSELQRLLNEALGRPASRES